MTEAKPAATARPAVLLDRDGTIIVDEGYLHDPDKVVLEKGAIEGLLALAASGHALVVVTNQSGIGRGYFTLSDAEAVNRRTADLLKAAGVQVDGWYICPHGPDDECGCRKPMPGLAVEAANALNLDLKRSWVIGDKPSDLGLADAVGARSILVLTGEGEKHRAWADSQWRMAAADLKEAAAMIISNMESSI